jgi:hypothetical protein
MKMNYFYAITALILFKDRHPLILTEKNETVLKYLKSINLRPEYDSKDVPDVTQICKATNLPRTKVYPILFQSYEAIIKSLCEKPHTISECVQDVRITIPYDEEDRIDGVDKEIENERALWAEFKLPIIPRLGETISLDFIDSRSNYSKHRRGVVVDIEHHISITEQRIVIHVHPFKNYYGQWEKLKRQHNKRERRLRELYSQRD